MENSSLVSLHPNCLEDQLHQGRGDCESAETGGVRRQEVQTPASSSPGSGDEYVSLCITPGELSSLHPNVALMFDRDTASETPACRDIPEAASGRPETIQMGAASGWKVTSIPQPNNDFGILKESMVFT